MDKGDNCNPYSSNPNGFAEQLGVKQKKRRSSKSVREKKSVMYRQRVNQCVLNDVKARINSKKFDIDGLLCGYELGLPLTEEELDVLRLSGVELGEYGECATRPIETATPDKCPLCNRDGVWIKNGLVKVVTYGSDRYDCGICGFVNEIPVSGMCKECNHSHLDVCPDSALYALVMSTLASRQNGSSTRVSNLDVEDSSSALTSVKAKYVERAPSINELRSSLKQLSLQPPVGQVEECDSIDDDRVHTLGNDDEFGLESVAPSQIVSSPVVEARTTTPCSFDHSYKYYKGNECHDGGRRVKGKRIGTDVLDFLKSSLTMYCKKGSVFRRFLSDYIHDHKIIVFGIM